MDTKDIDYSLKNIPVPTQSTYLKCLIDKTEHFIKRLRWAAFWFERKRHSANKNIDENAAENEEEEVFENYGFKTPRTPPQNQYLKAFDVYNLIQKVEFDNRRNHFQTRLRNDVREIKSGNKITVSADKSPNLYEVTVENYGKCYLKI